MNDLEKITKKEFQNILKEALDGSAIEVANMAEKVKEDSTKTPIYSPTIHTLLDSMYHNALLYNRVDCIDGRKDIFYKSEDGLPVLKYSKNLLKKKKVKGYE